MTTPNHKGGWEVQQFLSFLITEHIATLKKWGFTGTEEGEQGLAFVERLAALHIPHLS